MRRRSDFETAVRRGRRAGRPSLVVHIRTSEGADPRDARWSGSSIGTGAVQGADAPAPLSPTTRPPRVGFVVSRAVGSAVVRNRVKRRLRHLVAARVERLPAGSLIVIRANPGSANCSSAALSAEFDAALSRVLRTTAPPV